MEIIYKNNLDNETAKVVEKIIKRNGWKTGGIIVTELCPFDGEDEFSEEWSSTHKIYIVWKSLRDYPAPTMEPFCKKLTYVAVKK